MPRTTGFSMRALIHMLAVPWFIATADVVYAQEELVTDLSHHQVSIQSNFTGAELLLFGAINVHTNAKHDIVIVVRGPDSPAIVRQKEKVAGIWINYGARELTNVPGYYSVISTRVTSEIASQTVLEHYGIGLENLQLRSSDDDDAGPLHDFIEATKRIRLENSLYSEDENGIQFLGTSLFRASIEMPANVPDGRYTARVYLFSNGKIMQTQTSTLFVNKVGFERLVFDFANKQPLTYGVIAVLIAIFAGWFASAIFRGR